MKKKSTRARNPSKEKAMKTTSLSAGLIAGALLLSAADTQACGSTLFGTGQSSRFHAYRARVPANVLIYASPQLADSSATTEPKIQDGLKRAGHKVTVVADADSLSAALAEGHFDVVIADADDAQVVANRLDGSGQSAGIVPIVGESSDPSAVSLVGYPQTLRASAGIGQFLKAIGNVMSVRAK